VRRTAVGETWWVDGRLHDVAVTWTFDQGGPVLGYTSWDNPLTVPILHTVSDYGMLGPGSVVSSAERDAARALVGVVGPFLRSDDPRVRFLANGSDACDAAVRLARYATGRVNFASVGYHGSSTLFAHPPQDGGVPATVHRVDIEFGDVGGLVGLAGDEACLVLELPSSDDNREVLRACRAWCDRTGALLVLDELVTGFRLALGGAAEFYGVRPDLACYGKAMSNGRGVAALVGDARLLDPLADRVFYSNTFNGDPYNCAHVVGTLTQLRSHADRLYGDLWQTGHQLFVGLRSVGVPVVGDSPRSALAFPDPDAHRRFCAECVRRGVVLDRPNYASWAHQGWHVDRTVEVAAEAMGVVGP